MYAFLSSSRSDGLEIYSYNINYYRELLSSICSYNNRYWVLLGVHPIILITLPIFIKNRKDENKYPIFLLLCFLTLPLLLSKVGSIFAGFSYPNNRWSFVIPCIFAYITTLFINENSSINKNDMKYIISFVLLLLIVMYLARVNISLIMHINIIIFILTSILLLNKERLENKPNKINIYNIFLILIIVVGLIFFVYHFFEIEQGNNVSEYLKFNSINKLYSTSNEQIKDFDKTIEYIKKKDNSFYRIGKVGRT